MPRKVDLVVVTVLLAVICMSSACEKSRIRAKRYAGPIELFRDEEEKLGLRETDPLEDVENAAGAEEVKVESREKFTGEGSRVQATGRGKKMERVLATLLMTYKLKLMALFPSFVTAIMLLLASNALVGFFFSLFAAVLSLKA